MGLTFLVLAYRDFHGKEAVVYCVIFIVVRPHCSTTYVDVAYCYRPSSVVCRSVTIVSPAKTAESIVMTFSICTMVHLRNHMLDGGPDPPHEKGQF